MKYLPSSTETLFLHIILTTSHGPAFIRAWHTVNAFYSVIWYGWIVHTSSYNSEVYHAQLIYTCAWHDYRPHIGTDDPRLHKTMLYWENEGREPQAWLDRSGIARLPKQKYHKKHHPYRYPPGRYP